MADLSGLPPLPKSLSGLLQFSSAQWKEMERIHTMRTMIQRDLNQTPSSSNFPESSLPKNSPDHGPKYKKVGGSHTLPHRLSRTNRLDAQLAVLRKEMVGLRQLDMSLLCQLWSLNESIHEYKQILGDRMADSHAVPLSPGWEHNLSQLSSEECDEEEPPRQAIRFAFNDKENRSSSASAQNYKYHMRRISSSSSSSSFEFGNI